jgi:hypothetical protein
MATLVLNGPVGSNKKAIISQNAGLLRALGHTTLEICLGAEMNEIATMANIRLYEERYSKVSSSLIATLREAAAWRAYVRVLEENPEYVLVETPFNIPNDQRIMRSAYPTGVLAKMKPQRIVSVVSSPLQIIERLDQRHGQYYMGESLDENARLALEWTAAEAESAQIATAYLGLSHHHIALPEQNSANALAKLLLEPRTPLFYVAFPISDLGDQKEEVLARVDAFCDRLQRYSLTVKPLVLADQEKSPVHIRHTIHRDLNWFVEQSDAVIAYFPVPKISSGVFQEVLHNQKRGGRTILIGEPLAGTSPFKMPTEKPTYDTPDDFFNAIHEGTFSLPVKRLVDERGEPLHQKLYEVQQSADARHRY